jgi:hypothetical protein
MPRERGGERGGETTREERKGKWGVLRVLARREREREKERQRREIRTERQTYGERVTVDMGCG